MQQLASTYHNRAQLSVLTLDLELLQYTANPRPTLDLLCFSISMYVVLLTYILWDNLIRISDFSIRVAPWRLNIL